MKFPRKFPQNKILIRLNHAKSKKRSKKPVKQCEIETLFKIDPRVRLFRRVVNVSKSDGFNLGIDFSRPCSRNTNLSRRYVVRNDRFLGGLLRRFFLIPMPRGDNQDQRKLLLATSSNNRLENQGCI